MKRIADSKGRLTAVGIFRPKTAFDVTLLADRSIRVVPLAKRKIPVVKLKRNRDGTFDCPMGLTREKIRAAIRTDRGAQ